MKALLRWTTNLFTPGELEEFPDDERRTLIELFLKSLLHPVSTLLLVCLGSCVLVPLIIRFSLSPTAAVCLAIVSLSLTIPPFLLFVNNVLTRSLELLSQRNRVASILLSEEITDHVIDLVSHAPMSPEQAKLLGISETSEGTRPVPRLLRPIAFFCRLRRGLVSDDAFQCSDPENPPAPWDMPKLKRDFVWSQAVQMVVAAFAQVFLLLFSGVLAFGSNSDIPILPTSLSLALAAVGAWVSYMMVRPQSTELKTQISSRENRFFWSLRLLVVFFAPVSAMPVLLAGMERAAFALLALPVLICAISVTLLCIYAKTAWKVPDVSDSLLSIPQDDALEALKVGPVNDQLAQELVARLLEVEREHKRFADHGLS